MKNYGKVIGFIFLLLFFCGSTLSLQSPALAEDFSSPGPQWQAIPAYGPELQVLADWQGTSADFNPMNLGVELAGSIMSGESSDSLFSRAMFSEPGYGKVTNASSMISNLLDFLATMHTETGPMDLLSSLMGATNTLSAPAITQNSSSATAASSRSNTTESSASKSSANTKAAPKVSTTTSNNTSQAQSDYSATSDSTQNSKDLGLVSIDFFGTHYDDVRDAPSVIQTAVMLLPIDNSTFGWDGPMTPDVLSTGITADFDPSKPGRETKWYSPLILDTDRNGAIALDGGTIPFDIAPHLAGLETIPVPAVGKDMFLVWDKAGTETIEGTAREYKNGEIVDITELFGPTDYTRSDFSVLAYTDDGFTKLRKLCDVDNDGDVDKQDTALSAEVAAKLKLWSPLSGELILFKDTDIVIDIRAGSYERHPSDVEGWAVEYKMKDAQDNLVGYEWLTSKTGSLLCVDVLLAVQQ